MRTVHTFQANSILPGQVLFFEWDWLWRLGVLIGVCALGTWVIFWVKGWRQESTEALPAAPQEQLNHYQEMVEEGLLNPDELARIKARMDKQASETHSQPDDLPPPADESADTSS